MPCFLRPIHEGNDCHNPAGDGGGQFCSTPGSFPPIARQPRPDRSVDLPDFLRPDVYAAQRAGIVVHHRQQPEPVQTVTGEIHDPLARSWARGGETTFLTTTAAGKTHVVRAPRGEITITTRGGVFEPEEEVWKDTGGSFGYMPAGKRKKELTPESLPKELQATVEDVQSTLRHEIGHIMDDKSWGHGGKIGIEMSREIRAWTYAVEISPDHRVSPRMVQQGLESHAYGVFRKQAMLADPEKPWYQRMGMWDREEALERDFKAEQKTGVINIRAHRMAVAFAKRVGQSLVNYGDVLRKKGIVRVPQPPDPFFPDPKAGSIRRVQPGPGRRGRGSSLFI